MLSLLGLVLMFAGLELLSRYRAEAVVGSKEWNAHQVRLREHLDASPDEDERKREVYEKRLEAGAAKGVFADEEERRRAWVLKLHQNLYHSREGVESETLRQPRQDDQTW